MSFPSIILFGDSLIEQSFSPERHGFGAALANAYVRRADVLNRGLSGYNSDWVLPWLEKILEAQISEVLLWIIWVGANDACLPEFVYHVPLERYKENVRKMISSIRSYRHSKNSRILIITPPPIDHTMLKIYHRRRGADRSFAITAQYAAAVREVGAEYSKIDQNVGILDFSCVLLTDTSGAIANEDGSPSLKTHLTDGLHMGPKGYALLYKRFIEYVEVNWPELQPKNTPMMTSWVGDLDVVKEFEKRSVHSEL